MPLCKKCASSMIITRINYDRKDISLRSAHEIMYIQAKYKAIHKKLKNQ